jgi:hypothetical protein
MTIVQIWAVFVHLQLVCTFFGRIPTINLQGVEHGIDEPH